MKAAVFLFFIPLLLLLSSMSAFAGTFGELKSRIDAARAALVQMLVGKVDQAQLTQVKETAAAVQGYFAGVSAPAGKEKEFLELRKTWDEFKVTREEAIVPAVRAGNMEEAKKIASGIQKNRFNKMMKLLRELQSSERH